MKHINVSIILLFIIAPFSLNAQKEQVRGVYKTGDDLSKEKLSFDNNCGVKKIKIKRNNLFMHPYITIKQGDTSLRLSKNNLFGYRNCRGQIFRFKGKQELLLLNDRDQILIYKLLTNHPPPGSRTNVTNYYFSIGTSGAVQKLTIKNLKFSFLGNKDFQQLIDDNFKYNTDLARFDDLNKMYQINWILKGL